MDSGSAGLEDRSSRWPGAKSHCGTMAASRSPPPYTTLRCNPRVDPNCDPHYDNDEHQPQRRRLALPVQQSRSRFPGDGLDFRRPVMSVDGRANSGESSRRATRPAETIDLTDEVDGTQSHETAPRTTSATSAALIANHSNARRLPRFERDIIDIANSDDEAPAPDSERDHSPVTLPPPALRPSSHRPRPPDSARRFGPLIPDSQTDDIEFTGSRPVSNAQTRNHTPTMSGVRSLPREGPIIDLTDEHDDDVVLLDSRTLPAVNADHPTASASVSIRDPPRHPGRGIGYWAGMLSETLGQGRLRERFAAHYDQPETIHPHQTLRTPEAGILERTHVLRDHAVLARERLMHTVRAAHAAAAAPARAFAIPGAMNYETTGFDLGFDGGPDRAPTPKYEPPPDPDLGFTRNPAEDEVVVCPNCGDELAMGETELKQQVWVIKHCGHAYCGDCTDKRLRQASKKGKQRAVDPSLPPPFKKCVVDGCGRLASRNMMIHVYLGS